MLTVALNADAYEFWLGYLGSLWVGEATPRSLAAAYSNPDFAADQSL